MTHEITPDLPLAVASQATLAGLPLATLRAYRNELTAEEEKVSYWRRLIQFRLNLIKTQKDAGEMSTRDLVRALGTTGSGHRRQQLLSIDAHDELPQLPGLDDLWTTAIDLSDEQATQRLVDELNTVEQVLSDYRRRLHDRIDAATGELIARYKVDPNLSLELFPEDVR